MPPSRSAGVAIGWRRIGKTGRWFKPLGNRTGKLGTMPRRGYGNCRGSRFWLRHSPGRPAPSPMGPWPADAGLKPLQASCTTSGRMPQGRSGPRKEPARRLNYVTYSPRKRPSPGTNGARAGSGAPWPDNSGFIEEETGVNQAVGRQPRAFSLTAGSSATFTQTCTWGVPRKCHTNAGPSRRQLSHTPSPPRSDSL